jgi:hypothetical protein
MIAAHLTATRADLTSAATNASSSAAPTASTSGGAFSSLLANQSDRQTASAGGSVWSAHARKDAKKLADNATPYVAAAANIQVPPTVATSGTTGSGSTGSGSTSSGSTTSGVAATAASALDSSAMQAMASSASTTAVTNAGATATAANAGTTATAAASSTQSAATAQAGAVPPNGVKAPVGSAELNARVAAAAPLLHSQPALSLASLSPETLQSATKEQATTDINSSGSTTASTSTEASAAKTAEPDATALEHAVTPTTPTTTAALANAAANAVATEAGVAGADPKSTAADAAAANANVAAAVANTTPAAPSDPTQAAAAPQADTTTRAPLSFAPAADQVAIGLKQAASDGSNSIKIQLKPESLGAIDVKLDVAHDGHVTAVISADRSDTLNMLKQDQGALQQALRDAGLQADSSSLSFNLSNNPQPDFSQNTAQQSPRQTSGSGSDDDNEIVSAAAISPSQRRHAGSLDIQV